MRKQRNMPKKNKEVISRFDYYTHHFNQAAALIVNASQHLKRKEIELGPSLFHYFQVKRQNIRHFELINSEMLSQITEKIYKQGQFIQKQKANSSKNQQPQILNEEIEIMVTPNTHQQSNSENKSLFSSSSLSYHGEYLPSTLEQKQKSQKYSIYIVHTSKQTSVQWVYYVQRLTLNNVNHNLGQNTAQFMYEAIIGVQNATGFVNSILKTIFPQKYRTMVTNHSLLFEEKLGVFESTLIKQIKTTKIRNSNEERIAHPEFRRQDSLPIQEYKKFQRLKIQIYRFYAQMNRHRKINHYSIDNLICRFLKFKQYDYQQSLKSIKDYLNWQKSMHEKYNSESFQQYQKMNLYEMIGKDNEGRTILFFRPYNVYPDKIVDEAKYLDYTLYMLDIFIEENTQGYIDDFILMADYEPFGTVNFKLSMAKNVADRAKELFPDRQYKLICYGLNSFCYFVYRLIKPFLPSYVVDKTAIFGTDKQELKEYLSQYMNINELPAQILGQKSEKDGSTPSTNHTKLQKH